jgi:hypothetical protein
MKKKDKIMGRVMGFINKNTSGTARRIIILAALVLVGGFVLIWTLLKIEAGKKDEHSTLFI